MGPRRCRLGRSWPGNGGQILGWTGRRGAASVDFRQQRGIYVLYDDNFKFVYIGQTGAGNQRLLVRLRNHGFDHLAQRWSRFSWCGISAVAGGRLDPNAAVRPPALNGILNHVEAIPIASAKPRHRKRIEEAFGWAKTVGGMAQTVHRGVERVRSRFILTMAASNLARLPGLPGACGERWPTEGRQSRIFAAERQAPSISRKNNVPAHRPSQRPARSSSGSKVPSGDGRCRSPARRRSGAGAVRSSRIGTR